MIDTERTFVNQPPALDFTYSDGGREAAGYKGDVSDCATRAVSIALHHSGWDLPLGDIYPCVYKGIHEAQKEHFGRKRKKSRKSCPTPREYTYKKVTKEIIERLGGQWTATMHIGSGCQVHMRPDELPGGILIVNLSKHVSVVIDGVVYDTHDPCRGGDRCVYGYWEFK